jgi:23S rRNA (guanosine2251-2'-O)-methyltransferase
MVSAIKSLKEKGMWVVGLDPGGDALWTEFDYTVPVALVLGGEHRGIRRLVREHCDVLVRLPTRGKVASLNVSVAAGIALYEVVRQRLRPDA